MKDILNKHFEGSWVQSQVGHNYNPPETIEGGVERNRPQKIHIGIENSESQEVTANKKYGHSLKLGTH